MPARRLLISGGLATVLVLTVVLGAHDRGGATGINSVTTPDDGGPMDIETGLFTSLVLDASGNPVVAYSAEEFRTIYVLHCNDPNCAGGDDSIEDTGQLGFSPSIELDSGGNPVISFAYAPTDDLAILRCNDPNCTTHGITWPDATGDVGASSSLELDASGNPVVSYMRVDLFDLKVMHCNDPACTGGNESIGTEGDLNGSTSLELDSAGSPVVAYFSAASDLNVLHCNDPNCAAAGDITTSPDTSITGHGDAISLALDAAGYPVVGYNVWNPEHDLKLVHCNDPNCAPGGDTVTSPDTAGQVGRDTSLVLDTFGNPVMSYHDWSDGDLKVISCNDPNCAGSDESFVSHFEVNANVGMDTSLALDTKGRPVVSFHDFSNKDLELLHCVTRTCLDTSDDDDDGCSDVAELQTASGSETSGGRRDPKHFWDFYDVPTGLSLARDGSVSAPDIFGVIARFNTSGNPNLDPLSMPSSMGYHTAFDRGPAIGPDPWDLGAANGSIAATDIFAVIAQFNHSCT